MKSVIFFLVGFNIKKLFRTAPEIISKNIKCKFISLNMFLGYYQNETMSLIYFSVETDHIRRV